MTSWRAGTRVKKVNSEPGDIHQDGSRGTILEYRYDDTPPGSFYLIRWDDAKTRFLSIVRADGLELEVLA